MKDIYLVVNGFLHYDVFDNLYNSLISAFESRKVKINLVKNDQADYILTKKNKGVVLFFDKDVLLAKRLEMLGYSVVNGSFCIETCDDKAKTYLALLNKVKMPKTILAPTKFNIVDYDNFNFLKRAEEILGYPMIVKENRGSFGLQVHLVNDYNQLESLVKSFNHCNFLMQEFIKESSGKDIRVYVVNNKVVASALRYNENDFRSNVAQGGKMQVIKLKKQYEDMAIKACKCVKAKFGGVDLLIDKNGQPLCCEVNSNAHFKGLEQCTKISVSGAIADYIINLASDQK